LGGDADCACATADEAASKLAASAKDLKELHD
jgi:hypothetical protein